MLSCLVGIPDPWILVPTQESPLALYKSPVTRLNSLSIPPLSYTPRNSKSIMRFSHLCFLVAAARSGFVLSIPDVKVNTADVHIQDVPWKAEGCYSEAVGGRALAQASFYDYSNMTVDACQSFCASKGYPYAGLEYARECYVCFACFPHVTRYYA